MTDPATNPTDLQRMARELRINVPIMTTRVLPTGDVELYLYGGQVKTWRQPRPAADAAGGDDLTVVHGIGPKGAAALNDAGITRLSHLAAAYQHDIATLDLVLNTANLAKVGAWLEANHYL